MSQQVPTTVLAADRLILDKELCVDPALQGGYSMDVAANGFLVVTIADTVSVAVVAAAAQRAAADKAAQTTASTNRDTLTQKAQTALTTNQTFLALPAPTNTQVLAQVQMLTRECSALIRLVIGALDTTAGT